MRISTGLLVVLLGCASAEGQAPTEPGPTPSAHQDPAPSAPAATDEPSPAGMPSSACDREGAVERITVATGEAARTSDGTEIRYQGWQWDHYDDGHAEALVTLVFVDAQEHPWMPTVGPAGEMVQVTESRCARLVEATEDRVVLETFSLPSQ